MTLAQRYEWSGTPLTAGRSPAAAHLKAAASAADLSELSSWSESGRTGSFSAGRLAGPRAGLAELAGSTGTASWQGHPWSRQQFHIGKAWVIPCEKAVRIVSEDLAAISHGAAIARPM